MQFTKYFWTVLFFGLMSIGWVEGIQNETQINVVYLFGPSCGGKSTLGLALKERLRGRWGYIDRDAVFAQACKTEAEENALNAVLEDEIQRSKTRMIIDAQKPWRAKKENELYVLVSAPLEVLLERDLERTKNWKKDVARSKYATQYVIKTQQLFESMNKDQFDYWFDSSQVSVQDEVDIVQKRLEGPIIDLVLECALDLERY